MRTFGYAAAALLTLAGLAGAQAKKGPPLGPDSFYLLKSKTLEGKDADLKEYAGKVSLVVNLASQ
ncbi:MAG TPA: hypothetical protein VEN81_11750 [Planctomycetota bacterium]|nr:hypothetical protein [Planctomycetota bacterium]